MAKYLKKVGTNEIYAYNPILAQRPDMVEVDYEPKPVESEPTEEKEQLTESGNFRRGKR